MPWLGALEGSLRHQIRDLGCVVLQLHSVYKGIPISALLLPTLIWKLPKIGDPNIVITLLEGPKIRYP